MFNRNGSNNGHQRNGTGNGLVHSPPRTENGVTDNGHKPAAAIVAEHDLLWDGLSPAVTKALGQPLDPSLVSRRQGRAGRTFSYIEGHTAIDEANRVFGYGGWGFELVENVTLRQIETVDTQTGEVKVVDIYTAPVRVTVPGAPPRTDIGFHAVTDETADGHETAIKGSVTDGLKRALRSFGDRFGNGLYGDQAPATTPARAERVPAHADRKALPATASRSDDDNDEYLRKRVVELGLEQGFDVNEVRTAVLDRMGKSLDDLSASELSPLVQAAAKKVRQMRAG